MFTVFVIVFCNWGDSYMAKFISNLICVLVCFLVIELNLYAIDYNELLSYRNYIEHDIRNGNLISFENNKYEVNVYIDDKIIYEIKTNRKSFFNIKQFKTIEYRGIVD